MGFLGTARKAGVAGGANQALQNYLQFYLRRKDLQQEEAARRDRRELYDSMIKENVAQAEDRRAKIKNVAEYQEASRNLRGSQIMVPSGAGMEIPEDPYSLMTPGLMQELGSFPIGTGRYKEPTMEDRLSLLGRFSPEEEMKHRVTLAGQEKREPLITGEGDIRVVDRPGVKVPSKEKSLDFTTEKKVVGDLTFERVVGRNPVTGGIEYRGEWGSEPSARERPDKAEKLSMADVKAAYSMEIGNIKNQLMIDMTPEERLELAGQPDTNVIALLLSGRIGKTLSPEKKKLYIERLRKAESYYIDLTNQVLVRKKAIIPSKKAESGEEKQAEYEKNMRDAKDAVRKGASKAAVKKRLGEIGYTEKQLQDTYFNWLE